MSDSRIVAVLLGAAIVIGALFAPWYALELGPAARGAISSQAGQLPAVLADFTRQLMSLLPQRIEANAWQAFERTDIVLLCTAIAAAFAALLGRMDIATLAGAIAAGNTALVMVDRPGPHEFVSLQWGAWVGLGGAVLVVVASRMSDRSEPAPYVTPFDHSVPASEPTAPAPVLGGPARSVAPPS